MVMVMMIIMMMLMMMMMMIDQKTCAKHVRGDADAKPIQSKTGAHCKAANGVGNNWNLQMNLMAISMMMVIIMLMVMMMVILMMVMMMMMIMMSMMTQHIFLAKHVIVVITATNMKKCVRKGCAIAHAW